MRKLHKAAVAVAIISGFSFMGAGPATAQAAGARMAAGASPTI